MSKIWDFGMKLGLAQGVRVTSESANACITQAVRSNDISRACGKRAGIMPEVLPNAADNPRFSCLSPFWTM